MRYIILLSTISATLLFAASSKEDEKTGLVWQDNQDVGKIEKTYKEAIAYCSKLKIDGFEDWRLPTLAEAYTIVDMTRDRPALKGGFEMRISERFWTVTPFVEDPKKNAWRISMGYGEAEPYTKNRAHHVRCVRGKRKK